MCRRASVGSTQEPVPFQTRDIAPDGHLRNAQLHSQLAYMDGLLLCDSLKDSMPPINREHLGLAGPPRMGLGHPQRDQRSHNITALVANRHKKARVKGARS